MRIGSVEDLFDELDRVVAESRRGDVTRDAADYWTAMLTREGHPLNSRLPDEPLVDWHGRGLLGDLDGARVLDVGCGNGRNGAWLAERGADVVGVDLAAPLLDAVRPDLPRSMTVTALDVLRDPLPAGPFDVVYDSGCFHHLAPHRRITYRERILPLLAPGGRYAVVAFAQESQPSPSDREVLTSGDLGGGMSFLVEDLERIFASLHPVEVRRVRDGVPGTFGAEFLNAGLFRV
ncbi:class I SAM-dependent methyltransferase [Promicromonospora sp. NFX87]|uniref:class I SAM-dependent methyltransferase n=1 Tax=Promicromonospora sp. NFX87 TaxID=3402691 RepID=UPI003AFA510D